MDRKLVKKEKSQIYRDMKAKVDAVKEEYAKYKSLTQVEISVSHAVIDRQRKIH